MKRIKGIGLARIRGTDGRLGLRVYNSSPALPGDGGLSMVPFTSALTVDPTGMRTLTTLGAIRSVVPGNALDHRISDQRLDAVIEWFNGRTGRSASMLPQLLNTLVGMRILRSSDREGNTETFLYSLTHNSHIVGEGAIVYLIDLFDVEFSENTTQWLLKRGHLYFASQDELKAGKTRHGAPIASMASAALT